ncbi:MAG: hypothetical protein ACLFTG_05840 [Alphaproteobacteria bacterium]
MSDPRVAGAPWRTLPAELGAWSSVDERLAGSQEKGVRRRLMDRLAASGELG